MGFSIREGFPVWGPHETATVRQLAACAGHEATVRAALMADGHPGYAHPIGGVVAYEGVISPTGVGTDIACGNKAVATNLRWKDIRRDMADLMSDIYAKVSFGMQRRLRRTVEHEVLEDELLHVLRPVGVAMAGPEEQDPYKD